MNRKEALKMMALVGGGTIIGLELFLQGCKGTGKELVFTAETIALLDQIGDIIIPSTNTPGAKATKIGMFMQTMVSDCYTKEQQQIFMTGVEEIDKQAQSKYSKKFMALSFDNQQSLLTQLDKEAAIELKSLSKADKKATPPYFSLFKQLTVWGFFTSEIGQTEVLNYQPVPGRFDPCVPYKKGEKAFI